MDADRAGRLTDALRARGVMAHVVSAGVYEFGVRVVLDLNLEALWDVSGAAGLDAEIVSNGVLVGFIPHVPGSEDFTEQQLVDCIASAKYDLDGLYPPADRAVEKAAGTGEQPPVPPVRATPPAGRPQRRAHWLRRGRR